MSAKETKQEEPEEKHEDGAEGEASPKSKKKMIIAIAAVVVFALLGVGAYLMGFFGGSEEPPATEQTEGEAPHEGGEAKEGEHGEAPKEGEPGEAAKGGEHGAAASGDTTLPGGIIFHPLPDFLVNLNSATKRSSFLKVSVTLEVADATSLETIKGYEPRIIDSFQTYLRELRPEDLKGSGGIFRLREELLLRVNKIVQPAKVNDILFKDMIVQ
jgi:flagellar FliL protein